MNLLVPSTLEVLLFVLVSSRPALRQTTIVTVGEVTSDAPQCAKFDSAVCNHLGGQGYSYATFPNPLAPMYLPNAQKAEAEGNTVIAMAVASKCSQDVAMFLCFAYFPLCTENRPPVLPCKSLCQRVRSDCEPYLNSSFGIRWPQWADCDNIDKVVSATNAGCVKETPVVESPPVCGTCGITNKVYSTTFRISNSNLTFAAKAIVVNRTVSNHTVTYKVNVSRGYDLACKTPSSRLPQSIVIQTGDERCKSCVELTTGSTYFIGGDYNVRKETGAVEWGVPSQNGVVSPWSDDYETKMDKWMTSAAKDRQCSLS